jgi:hypothetical protein
MSQTASMRAGIASQVTRVHKMISRATFAPMALRGVVAVTVLIGFALAFSPRVFGSSVAIGLVLVALLPTFFPRGSAATIAITVIVAGYMLATSFGGMSITTWRVVALAGAIYVTHSAAAFAAVLPYDSVVSPGLFVPWIIRTAAVIVLTGLVGVLVAALPSLVGTHRMVLASVGGFFAMLALALYLFYLWRRA